MKSKWLSRHEREYFVCEFSRFGDDRAALAQEIVACHEVLAHHQAGTLLVAADLYDAPITPELVAFLRKIAEDDTSPVRRLAIIGVSTWRRRWLKWRHGVVWPAQSRCFLDWELGKDWVVGKVW